MDGELALLLILIAASIPIGLLTGIALRKKRPALCKAWVKWCIKVPRWFYAGALVTFAGMSFVQFAAGRRYFGVFLLLFGCVEAYALVRPRSEGKTAELEARLDAWDPTKLWPLWGEKQAQGADPTSPTDGDP